jgi:Right handed beta helix region
VINSRAIVTALTFAAALLGAPTADAIERHATPSNLTTVFSNARGGDTILLASGNYGTFTGGMKAGMVTLRPEPRAKVTMALEFNPAANIQIVGVTITGAVLTDSRTRKITIRNSNVPGQVRIDTREVQHAGVTLANNDFHDWDTCSSCGEARVFLTGGSQPSGVTIRNSRFHGGLSDGIQNGSYGTKIIGNEFYAIEPGSPSGVHADAIQLYGSSHTVIRGNYMHDMPEVPFIMAPDGADHELIEDNVVEGSTDGYPFITLFSDDSSIVRHNTFADGACAFNIRCGVLRLSNKDSDDLGHGTVIEDNILGKIQIEGSSTIARRSHNLLSSDGPSGPGEIRGKPTYVGGASPRSRAGFRLKVGSLGVRKASDRLNIGARITP